MAFGRISSVPRYARASIEGLAAKHRQPTRSKADYQAWAKTVGLAVNDLWAAKRSIVRFLISGDQNLAFDLRARFGLNRAVGPVPVVSQALFAGPDDMPVPPDATIIIPVFNAANQTSRLLARLPQTLQAGQQVLIVDDGSTDPSVHAAIAAFARAWPKTRVVRHRINRGFVAAANSAFARLDDGHHAILLNSDTLPPKNWVDRLLAPIARDPSVATVTPLSNMAEIASVPRAEIDPNIDPALLDEMDQLAKTLPQRDVDLPTGVGFCMALNRRFLDELGGFDPVFGRGYGEEVDWCRRARAKGGRNVAATNLYIGHDGASSFGAAKRAQMVRRANRRLANMHPEFMPETRIWSQRDPLLPERLALAMVWLAKRSTGSVPIYFAHVLGGGAETALQNEVQSLLDEGCPGIVILRAGGPHLWRVELLGRRFQLIGDVAELDTLRKLLVPLNDRRVVYACSVGTSDPEKLPSTLAAIAEGHALELQMHDYFPISPSWNLIGSDGQFNGIPPLSTKDPAHGLPAIQGRPGMPHRAWRKLWGNVFDQAGQITVFSDSGANLTRQAYPACADRIRVVPHRVKAPPARLPTGGRNVGILGGINLAKGGAVLERLAVATPRRLVLIGELDGRFRLPDPHLVHGRYEPAQIGRLARRYDIGVWLIPSIWPETFSFATREALATGLPVLVFNLGAQAEAAQRAENGIVVDTDPLDADALSSALENAFAPSATGQASAPTLIP